MTSGNAQDLSRLVVALPWRSAANSFLRDHCGVVVLCVNPVEPTNLTVADLQDWNEWSLSEIARVIVRDEQFRFLLRLEAGADCGLHERVSGVPHGDEVAERQRAETVAELCVVDQELRSEKVISRCPL